MALHPSLNIISLCTGGGGLDLGIELACPAARPVLYVEREAYGCAVLVTAIEAGLMAPAPVWSDVRTFRGRSWRGLVDLVAGGIPCQPWSLAGKREGANDERDLWPDARRIVAAVRPRAVLIENVPGMLTAKPGEIPGALRVRRDLSRLGYRVEAGLFSAEECEANHERQRVFILGVALGDPKGSREGRLSVRSGRSQQAASDADGTGSSLRPVGVGQADPDSPRRPASGPRPEVDAGPQPEPGSGELAKVRRDRWDQGAEAAQGQQSFAAAGSEGAPAGVGQADPSSAGPQGRQRRRSPAGRDGPQASRPAAELRGSPVANADDAQGRRPDAGQRAAGRAAAGGAGREPLFVPGPADIAAWIELLSIRPDLEPSVRRGADGLAARVERLFMLGNGVVPLAGAYAFRTLVHAHAAAGVPFAIDLVRLMESACSSQK